jgi:hypothetical protein
VKVATEHFLRRAVERWGYRPSPAECRTIQEDVKAGKALGLGRNRYLVRVRDEARVVVVEAGLLVTALVEPTGLNRRTQR